MVAKKTHSKLHMYRQLDQMAKERVESIIALLDSHVEHNRDISQFFGAVCPVHGNGWECLEQESVS